MPKTIAKKNKPIQPIAPTEPEQATVPVVTSAPVKKDLKIIYPTVVIKEYSTTSELGPVTVAMMKEKLGWETEEEYKVRMVKENPNTKPDHWLYGEVFHCRDTGKNKVRTENNANNRPFDETWCNNVIQMVLRGQWAGPLTIPGETINGETVRISKYGQVLSGQHQWTAGILADEYLQNARAQLGVEATDEKYPIWKGHDHIVLETVVITGLSDDPRVLMTIDYNKPRTAADVFYTSEVFKNCTSQERKELCRMLAAAVDLLWTRTDAKGYRTHPELIGFLERHKTLLKCVEHIFTENGAAGGRKISKHYLSAGQCAAMLYLMGCSSQKTTDISDEYRNQTPPTEKVLDWEYYDRAEDFWVYFASSEEFSTVRTALNRLMDSESTNEDNLGLGGRLPEKLAIISAAWEHFKDFPATAGSPFTEEDLIDGGLLSLSYNDLDDKGKKLPDGKIKLLSIADFYGIDCPQVVESKTAAKAPSEPPPPSKEDIEKGTQEAMERRKIAMQKIEELRKAKK